MTTSADLINILLLWCHRHFLINRLHYITHICKHKLTSRSLIGLQLRTKPRPPQTAAVMGRSDSQWEQSYTVTTHHFLNSEFKPRLWLHFISHSTHPHWLLLSTCPQVNPHRHQVSIHLSENWSELGEIDPRRAEGVSQQWGSLQRRISPTMHCSYAFGAWWYISGGTNVPSLIDSFIFYWKMSYN